MESITFSDRILVPEDILVRELDGQAVLLNLGTESYYGLDEVGLRMWGVLTTSDSLEAAYDVLLATYDVEPEQLRQDMQALITDLIAHGLVQIEGKQGGDAER